MSKNYAFTLRVTPNRELTTAELDRFFERCSDDLPGRDQDGAYVAFERKADSLDNAIIAAVDDLASLDLGLHVESVIDDDAEQAVNSPAVLERLRKQPQVA